MSKVESIRLSFKLHLIKTGWICTPDQPFFWSKKIPNDAPILTCTTGDVVNLGGAYRALLEIKNQNEYWLSIITLHNKALHSLECFTLVGVSLDD